MSILTPLIQAIDSDYFPHGVEETRSLPEKMDWGKVLPFAILHLGCAALSGGRPSIGIITPTPTRRSMSIRPGRKGSFGPTSAG